MWKSTEYCAVSSTWACNHDPSHSASYTFAQDVINWTEENATPVDDVPSGDKLVCTQEKDGQSMELYCECKPHHSVSITGIVVLSEARTVECYTSKDGYLQTFRGSEVSQTKCISEESESMEDDVKLYYTVIKLEEKLKDVTLKFLGFGSKPKFTLIKLELVLVCEDEQRGQPMGIDLSKVKGYLSSMGGNVSEGAMNMLKSVEQYQATQLSGLGGLQSLLSAPLPAVTGHPQDRLSALLSMITSSRTETQSSESQTSNEMRPLTSHDFSQNSSSQSNEMSDPRSLRADFHENQSEESMFEMLKGICGKVSAMRVSEEQRSTESSDQSKESEGQTEKVQEDSTATVLSHDGLNVEALRSVFEKTASEIVSRSEQRLLKFIDMRLIDMEARINNKLDNMMKALQKNGHPLSTEAGQTT